MRKILKTIKICLNKAKILLITAILAFNLPFHGVAAVWNLNNATALIGGKNFGVLSHFSVTGGDAFLAENMPEIPKTLRVVLTAYSSTPDQTDSTPFITASNTRVRDGIVAANFLAFGTKVQIPSLFGDKVFTVEDRMARKHGDKIDIWFPERHLAKRFGVKEAEVIVLQ